jgi:hypothetical protein
VARRRAGGKGNVLLLLSFCQSSGQVFKHRRCLLLDQYIQIQYKGEVKSTAPSVAARSCSPRLLPVGGISTGGDVPHSPPINSQRRTDEISHVESNLVHENPQSVCVTDFTKLNSKRRAGSRTRKHRKNSETQRKHGNIEIRERSCKMSTGFHAEAH